MNTRLTWERDHSLGSWDSDVVPRVGWRVLESGRRYRLLREGQAIAQACIPDYPLTGVAAWPLSWHWNVMAGHPDRAMLALTRGAQGPLAYLAVNEDEDWKGLFGKQPPPLEDLAVPPIPDEIDPGLIRR